MSFASFVLLSFHRNEIEFSTQSRRNFISIQYHSCFFQFFSFSLLPFYLVFRYLEFCYTWLLNIFTSNIIFSLEFFSIFFIFWTFAFVLFPLFEIQWETKQHTNSDNECQTKLEEIKKKTRRKKRITWVFQPSLKKFVTFSLRFFFFFFFMRLFTINISFFCDTMSSFFLFARKKFFF